MSTSIDERVVSMKFDNAQFKRGVAESIGALDTLDSKLDMSSAEKNFEKLNKAAGKVKLGGLENAAQSVQVKFSLMSAAALSAIDDITKRAMHAGESLVKSMSVDQVTAGFDKYTSKTKAVQTIMNATGKTIDEVNTRLAKLQWFSDETSYSFTDMVESIGKFTSVGVDLDTATSAIMGIDLAAAHAGATTVEAGRAMYNFSQALSAGKVQLIDWRSIDNANMATATLKQTLIDAAVACGTLYEQEGKYYTVAKDVEVSTQSFNNTLQEGWLTSNALLQGLSKYSNYAESVYDVADAFDTCTDAMAATSSEGMELGAAAFKAGQEARTFTDAIEATKDAVSSGWSRTFEIIFGDYKESVKLWSDLTGTLWDIFASGAEGRNQLLSDALTTGWKQLVESQISDADHLREALQEVAATYIDDVDQLEVINTDFEESLKEGWLTSDMFRDAISKITGNLYGMTMAEAKANGYTEDTIKEFFELKKALDTGAASVDDIVANLNKLSGRENFIQAISNAYHGLLTIVEPVKEAISEVFPAATADGIYRLTERIKEFTAQFGLSESAARTLKAAIKVLIIPIQALVAILQVGAKMIGTFIQMGGIFINWLLEVGASASKTQKIFENFFGKDRYTRVVSALTKVSEKLSKALGSLFSLFSKGAGKAVPIVLNNISSALKFLGGGLIDVVTAGLEGIATLDFTNLRTIGVSAFEAITNAIGKIGSVVSNAMNAIKEFVGGFSFSGLFSSFKQVEEETPKLQEDVGAKGVFSDIAEAGKKLIETLKNVAKAIYQFIDDIDPARALLFAFGLAVTGTMFNIMRMLDEVTKAIANFSSVPKQMTKALKSITKTITNTFNREIAASARVQSLRAFAEAVLAVAASLAVLSVIPADKLNAAAGAILAIMGALAVLSTGMTLIGKALIKTADNIAAVKQFTKSMRDISSAVLMLSAALIVLNFVNVEDIGDKVLALSIALGALTVAALALAKWAPKLSKGSGFIIALAVAVSILAGAITKLSQMDLSSIEKNAQNLLGIVGILAAVSLAASQVKFGSALGVTLLIGDIFLMVNALKTLETLEIKNLDKVLISMGGIIAAIGLLSLATAKAGANAAKFAVAVVAITGAIILLKGVVDALGQIDPNALIRGSVVVGTAILVFGAFATLTANVGQYVNKLAPTFVAIGIAVVLLGHAIEQISAIPRETIDKGYGVVMSVMAMFALIMAASSIAKKATGTVVALTAAIGIMVTGLAILSILDDGGSTADAADALSTIIVSVGAAIALMSLFDFKKAVPMAILMGVLIGVTIAALAKLKEPNYDDILKSIAAFGLAMTAFGATLVLTYNALNASKAGAKRALNLLALEAALIPEMIIIGIFLVQFANTMPEGKSEEVLAAAAGVALCIAAMSLVVKQADKALEKSKGVADNLIQLAIGFIPAIGVFMLATWALVQMEIPPETLIAYFAAIGGVILGFTALAAIVGAAAKVIDTASFLPAAGKLMVFIAVAALLFGALAALAGSLLGDLSVLQRGADAFSIVGEAIGGFFGHIIGKFVEAVGVDAGNGLVALANGLTQFANAFGEFVAAATVAGTAEAVSTVTNFLNAVSLIADSDALKTGIFNKDTSFDKLGTELEEFAEPFAKFCTTISSAQIDTAILAAAITAAQSIADIITAFAGNDDVIEALNNGTLAKFGTEVSAFGGPFTLFCAEMSQITNPETVKMAAESAKILGEFASNLQEPTVDLAKYGGTLADFGIYFRTYADTVSGITPATLTASNTAIDSVIALSKTIPNEGGLLGMLLGNNNIATFGENLFYFGAYFTSYAETVKDIKADALAASNTAADSIIALSKTIPNTGGVLGWLIGDNDLATFGKNLKQFGQDFKYYAGYVAGINNDVVTGSATAAGALVALANDLPEDKGILGGLFGKKTMDFDDFGKSLKSFGEAFQSYATTVATIDWAAVDSSIRDIQDLLDLSTQLTALTGTEATSLGTYLTSLADNGITKFTTAFQESVPQITTAIETTFTDVANKISDSNLSDKLKEVGTKATDELSAGLTETKQPLIDAATEVGNQVITTTKATLGEASPSKEMYDIGKFAVEGLANGLKENESLAQVAIGDIAANILTTIKSFFKIKSPSRVMEDEVGHYIVEGIANGITDDMSAEEAAEKKAENIFNAFQTAMDNASSHLDTADLEYQLWEKLNPNATDKDKTARQAEMLEDQLNTQAQRVRMAYANWNTLVDQVGSDNDKTKEAYNLYLQEQISMADLAQQMVGETQETAVDQREAALAYSQFMTESAQALQDQGFTLDQIKEYAAKQAGYNLPGAVEEGAASTVQEVINKYMGQVDAATEGLGSNVEVSFGEMVTEAVSKGTSSGVSKGVAAGFDTGLNEVVEETKGTVADFVSNILGGEDGESPFDKIINTAKEAFTGGDWDGSVGSIFEGISEGVSKRIDQFKTLFSGTEGQDDGIASAMLNAFESFLGINSPSYVMYTEAGYIMEGLKSGITDGTDIVTDGITYLIGAMLSKLRLARSDFYKVGQYCMEGFKEGMKSKIGEIAAEAASIAKKAYDAAMAAIDAGSPSKLFMKVGNYVDQGFAMGMRQQSELVRSSASSMAHGALSAVSDSVLQAIDYVQQNADMSPVITPVLDTSSIDQGIGRISTEMDAIKLANVQMSVDSLTAHRVRTEQDRQNGSGNRTYTFNQYNSSPKALNRSEIYRQTKNQFSRFKEVTR